MIHRSICPICGSENPEGAEFCQVCNANLNALPDEFFTADGNPVNPPQTQEIVPQPPENDEPDLDSPVPVWLQKRFQKTEKPDMDSYVDALFGMSGGRTSTGPAKVLKPLKPQKSDPVYQPYLENLVEPPLIEPDQNSPKTIEEEIPGIADFMLRRPARKWEDLTPGRAAAKPANKNLSHDFSSERPAKKWDDGDSADFDQPVNEPVPVQQLPLWWQDDPPLVEPDDGEWEDKSPDEDDPELLNSVSPTKLINAGEIFDSGASAPARHEARSGRSYAVEYEPESGSLLSDLLNEMNENSVSLTPGERQNSENGTVFFSGNHPHDDDIPEPDTSEIIDIDTSDESGTGNAAMLDRILRGIGYKVEGEPLPVPVPDIEKDPVPEPVAAEPETKPLSAGKDSTAEVVHQVFVPQIVENPLIPDEGGAEEKDIDPYDLGIGDGIPTKDDDTEDLDIPWDLFGAADMSLPQSPEDPAYRTFSRSGIPDETDTTAYQQRMISSILGKIIQAENFVRPDQKVNSRYVSFGARLFWTALAVCGVVLIMSFGLLDHLAPGTIPADGRSEAFYKAVGEAEGNALVVIDYTPAYSSQMDPAADGLLSDLEGKTDKLYLAVLNPGAMPGTSQLLEKHGEKLEFAGWWPAGLISIRTRIAFGNIPRNIWLLTSESSSLRNWAEQLSASNAGYSLHVAAPGQLEPLLKPYLDAEMVKTALCSDMDLLHYGESLHTGDRNVLAVWYLSALVPLAWLSGALMKFFKTEPKYGKKFAGNADESQEDPDDKELDNGRGK